MKLQKVNAVQDSDCHWYIIPEDMLPKFQQLNSSSDPEAEYEFIDLFDQYRTGGDVNNIQLYAEI